MQFKIPNLLGGCASLCALAVALAAGACDDPDAIEVHDLEVETIEPEEDPQAEPADRSVGPEEAVSHHGGWHGGHHGGHHGGWHGGHHGGHHGGWHGGHGGWDGDDDGDWDGDDGGWDGDDDD